MNQVGRDLHAPIMYLGKKKFLGSQTQIPEFFFFFFFHSQKTKNLEKNKTKKFREMKKREEKGLGFLDQKSNP